LAFLDQPSKKESKKAAAERAAAVAGTIQTLDIINSIQLHSRKPSTLQSM